MALPQQFTVPEGGAVNTYWVDTTAPRVQRTEGGTLIVDLCLRPGDALVRFEALALEVTCTLEVPGPPILLAAEATRVSDLFAPDLRIVPVPALVIWVLYPGPMLHMGDAPHLLQQTLYRIYLVANRRPGMQLCVLAGPRSPASSLLAAVLGEYAIPVRVPADDGAILCEARRPEGVFVTSLACRALAKVAQHDPAATAMQREKYLAQVSSDGAALERLMAEERQALAARIAQLQGAADG